MSHLVRSFLQTEITCIPKIINRYAGTYFNNTLCNAAFWLVCIWFLLHALFNFTLEVILRRMKYPGYIRQRLKQSLWYIGFHSASFFYCIVTLVANKTDILNNQRTYTLSDSEYIPSQFILGCLILSTFYIHICIWEFWLNGFNFIAIDYLLLVCFMVYVNIIRWLELTFSLAIIVSMQQSMLEVTRILSIFKTSIAVQDLKNLYNYTLITSFYCLISVNIFAHLVLIPLHFIIPIGYSLLQKNEASLLILNVILWSWIAVEIYISPSLRLMQHYVCHVNGTHSKSDCLNGYIDCVLYPPRLDTMYKIQQMRTEIKERKAKLDKKKRPKKNVMLVQTLKCVMAIKRKLNRQQIVVEKVAAAGVELANRNLELQAISNNAQNANESDGTITEGDCSAEIMNTSEESDFNGDDFENGNEKLEEAKEVQNVNGRN